MKERATRDALELRPLLVMGNTTPTAVMHRLTCTCMQQGGGRNSDNWIWVFLLYYVALILFLIILKNSEKEKKEFKISGYVNWLCFWIGSLYCIGLSQCDLQGFFFIIDSSYWKIRGGFCCFFLFVFFWQIHARYREEECRARVVGGVWYRQLYFLNILA